MQRLFITALSTLALTTVAYRPASAQTIAVGPTAPTVAAITPADLAFYAYRGELDDQGIAGYSSLALDYQLGSITAEDVVNSAIAAGYLTADALDDASYVNAVQAQLDIISNAY